MVRIVPRGAKRPGGSTCTRPNGVNLLGVSRRGTRLARRLGRIAFHPGDVLLLQGRTELVQAALPRLGLLPLAERELRVRQRRRLFFPVAVFVGAVLLASFEIVPVQIAFVAAAAVLLVTRVLTLQAAYQAIDWPVIILLGAMIPVGEALETTGGAARIAMVIADLGGALPAWATLGIVLVTTMLLSAVINNARGGDTDGANRDRGSGDAWCGVRSVFDGGCHRRVVSFPHADRSSVKHDSDGSGRLSVWRLLQDGASACRCDRCGRYSAHHVGLADGDLGWMTMDTA